MEPRDVLAQNPILQSALAGLSPPLSLNLKTAVKANTARLTSSPDTRCGVSFS
jgi:hypothetical protein